MKVIILTLSGDRLEVKLYLRQYSIITKDVQTMECGHMSGMTHLLLLTLLLFKLVMN